MNQPMPPLIAVGNKNRYLFIFTESIEEVSKITLCTYWRRNSEKDFYFDSNGNIWDYSFHQPQPNFPKTWWRILLAHTFYNPYIQVEAEWQIVGEYDFNDLKMLCIQCIENDDDVLTQYVEPDYLITKIVTAKSFEELVIVLNTCVFEIDEDELYKECS
jgi:hypothetical protein